ncbi:hypothetical protein STIAU_3212 [Stigmatella aurantiaca DW4/3-1]|uniref:Uncharacterized protein n=1 Tax=Stigmatella aurantiaca (strain DW4/3-1) TaxID=378806 RepID=Q093G4_STIAD|nr:hypothetical protein STIAU_3212 [Stigmatella aurantiaca DW4/3-1]
MSSPSGGNGNSWASPVTRSTRNSRSRNACEGKGSGKVGLPTTGMLTAPRQNRTAPRLPSWLSAVLPPWQPAGRRTSTWLAEERGSNFRHSHAPSTGSSTESVVSAVGRAGAAAPPGSTGASRAAASRGNRSVFTVHPSAAPSCPAQRIQFHDQGGHVAARHREAVVEARGAIRGNDRNAPRDRQRHLGRMALTPGWGEHHVHAAQGPQHLLRHLLDARVLQHRHIRPLGGPHPEAPLWPRIQRRQRLPQAPSGERGPREQRHRRRLLLRGLTLRDLPGGKVQVVDPFGGVSVQQQPLAVERAADPAFIGQHPLGLLPRHILGGGPVVAQEGLLRMPERGLIEVRMQDPQGGQILDQHAARALAPGHGEQLSRTEGGRNHRLKALGKQRRRGLRHLPPQCEAGPEGRRRRARPEPEARLHGPPPRKAPDAAPLRNRERPPPPRSAQPGRQESPSRGRGGQRPRRQHLCLAPPLHQRGELSKPGRGLWHEDEVHGSRPSAPGTSTRAWHPASPHVRQVCWRASGLSRRRRFSAMTRSSSNAPVFASSTRRTMRLVRTGPSGVSSSASSTDHNRDRVFGGPSACTVSRRLPSWTRAPSRTGPSRGATTTST